ncbi:MAG: HTH-type transcriptional regulator HdfR [Candidatus Celerinatantimonas neptuna]|nr:MAG: HTH-type transcriptional regulator HdfR [Candidatus Celerinatantimonas neptuna]
MNLEWYYTFVCISKYKSYRKAAEQLYITQTAVFNRIKSLENHLEVKLVEKHGRNIRLTNIGIEFLTIAKEILQCYEKGLDKIKRISDNKVEVTIFICEYIATYLITGFISFLNKTDESIRLCIHVIEENSIDSLKEQHPDLIITRKLQKHSKYKCEKVCEGKIELAVPNTSENELYNDEGFYFNKYPIISENHPEYWKSLKVKINSLYNGVKYTPISSVFVTEEMISLGQGISYLPIYLSKKNNRKIKFIQPNSISPPISFTYIYYQEETALIKNVVEIFKKYINIEKVMDND